MKTTSLIALALVALGMSTQASPAPAKSAAASGSANIERVDYRCYYNCMRQGRDDCDWLCEIPGPDIPMRAAKPGTGAGATLHKRDYRCYLGCIRGCDKGDNACFDQCAWDCAGSGGDPPMKKE